MDQACDMLLTAGRPLVAVIRHRDGTLPSTHALILHGVDFVVVAADFATCVCSAHPLPQLVWCWSERQGPLLSWCCRLSTTVPWRQHICPICYTSHHFIHAARRHSSHISRSRPHKRSMCSQQHKP